MTSTHDRERPSFDAIERSSSRRPEEMTAGRLWRVPPPLREALSRRHTPSLDGLRMVAVFLVVFYHFGFQWVPGGHGVLLFFVLSGFLITWLLLEEQRRFGTISLRLFYLRRALRIFPAFFCFWLLWTAALVLSGKHIVWGQAISALLYVSNYYHAILGDPDTGYSHTWSLGIEEQYYLLWPLCLLALWRKRERAPAVLAGSIGAIWAHRAVLQFVVGADQGYFYSAFDARADHLLIGCLLAVLLHEGRLAWLWERLCTVRTSLATLALLVLSVWMSEQWGFAYRDVVGFAIDPVLMAALIVQAMALRAAPLWRWLNWPWVVYLGTISYSIYLYQQIVIGPVKRAIASGPLIVELAAVLGAVVLAGAASYHLVERPFLRLKETLASRKGSPAVARERARDGRAVFARALDRNPRAMPDAIRQASEVYAEGIAAVMAALDGLTAVRGEVHRRGVEDDLNRARASKEELIAAVSASFDRVERECRRAVGVRPPRASGAGNGDVPGRWTESWKRPEESVAADVGARDTGRGALENSMRVWQSLARGSGLTHPSRRLGRPGSA